MKQIRVSVALATYNGIKYIKKQLDSIVGQTVKADQVVISDDGSEDGTYEFIKDYIARKKLGSWEIFQNSHEHGITNNFINALEKCDGDVFFLCDQDDIWKKDKIERIKNIFANNPDVQCVISKILYIINNKVCSRNTAYTQKDNHDVEIEELLKVCSYLGMSSAFKKEVFFNANKEKMLSSSHDWILFITALNMGRIRYLGKTCQYYRVHDNNASISKNDSFYINRMKLIERKIKHLNVLKDIQYIEKDTVSKFLDFYDNVFHNIKKRNMLGCFLMIPKYIKLDFPLKSFFADAAAIILK